MNTSNQPVPAPNPLQTPEQLARLNAIRKQQGITGPTPIEQIIGSGRNLWDSDEDFDKFVASIEELRRQKD